MNISLPTEFKITPLKDTPHGARVEISPLYPGYGHTVGNALRRVLLSSLSGAGVTAVKVKGADHEFMALAHIKEEVLEIILNLKQLDLKLHTDEKEKLILEVKGKKVLTAANFKKNPNVEIGNPDQHIATLTNKDAEFLLEATVENGLGFSSVEEREKETEVGTISIDTAFAPIKSVGFEVENIRVGKQTNYDKVILIIETNGTIEVKDALHQSAKTLIDQFNFIAESTAPEEESKKKATKKKATTKKKK